MTAKQRCTDVAELAANAAFAIIKQAFNGRNCFGGNAIAEFVGAKENYSKKRKEKVAALIWRSLWLWRKLKQESNSSRL